MKKEIHLKARIERVENNVNKLAWEKAQRENLVKLEDRVGKIEDCIDWEVARTTMRGVPDVPKNLKAAQKQCVICGDTAVSERRFYQCPACGSEYADADQIKANAESQREAEKGETPKQRWMRENLRPGEVYAGIVLDLYGTTGYDYHLIVGVDSPEYMPATIREFQLINMNVNGRYAFVRRIPVE